MLRSICITHMPGKSAPISRALQWNLCGESHHLWYPQGACLNTTRIRWFTRLMVCQSLSLLLRFLLNELITYHKSLVILSLLASSAGLVHQQVKVCKPAVGWRISWVEEWWFPQVTGEFPYAMKLDSAGRYHQGDPGGSSSPSHVVPSLPSWMMGVPLLNS